MTTGTRRPQKHTKLSSLNVKIQPFKHIHPAVPCTKKLLNSLYLQKHFFIPPYPLPVEQISLILYHNNTAVLQYCYTSLTLGWYRLTPLSTDFRSFVKFYGYVHIKLLLLFLYIVTCSRHLNLTDFEVGASCSIALQGKAKTGYPRVSRGSFFIRLRIFSVLLCTFFIYSFSFFQNIDRRIHIPVHPVSTFA